MKLLLDTHALLWWDSEPTRLSSAALAACQDDSNSLCLSLVSIWEIQIKSNLGKLRIGRSLREFVEAQLNENHLEICPITLNHVLFLEQLSTMHKDPFDRLLAAQAIVDGMTLISKDSAFDHFQATRIW